MTITDLNGVRPDASVAISWCFPGDPTEDTPYSRRILKELISEDAVVPDIRGFEIANNIFVSCNRRKRITEQQVQEYLGLLKALPIRVASQPLWANVDLESTARRHNLAAYDVAYPDLAQRMGIALATLDGPLSDAAKARGIPILGFGQ